MGPPVFFVTIIGLPCLNPVENLSLELPHDAVALKEGPHW